MAILCNGQLSTLLKECFSQVFILAVIFVCRYFVLAAIFFAGIFFGRYFFLQHFYFGSDFLAGIFSAGIFVAGIFVAGISTDSPQQYISPKNIYFSWCCKLTNLFISKWGYKILFAMYNVASYLDSSYQIIHSIFGHSLYNFYM